jgi:protein-disulfide isomerase
MLTKLRICLYMALLIPGVAAASETTVKQAMQMKYPGIQVESVARTPIEKILAYGRQQGINGTPTLFFADGQRTTGAIPADQLEKLLAGVR